MGALFRVFRCPLKNAPKMPLTDTACKKAVCPPDQPRLRLADEKGLYLEATKAGKYWRWKNRHGGKEKRLALGVYPEVSLAQAREARDDARKVLKAGTDPGQLWREAKAANVADQANTFEAVAREFHATQASGWSPRYATRWIERMEKDLFPYIGKLTLPAITAPVLLDALRKVEKRGANETAHTLRQTAGQVFRYGVQTGRCDRSPVTDLHGALKPIVVKHMAAVLEPAKAGELLRSIDGYAGQPMTKAALALSALLFQRPGNIRQMEWAWIDFDKALLTIPSQDMKRRLAQKINGRPHFVPLAPQAIAILKELQPLTGHGRYVFPSLRTGERAMSDNTINAALRRMGFASEEMSAHGFRAMARTLMIERIHGISADVIEAQLAHGKSGPLGAAYDRAEFMEQRRRMMSEWADYLDKLRMGAEVIQFKKA